MLVKGGDKMKIYDILGIDSNASTDEIRAAYQEKLKHIDMSRHIEDYQNLREAYNLALRNVHNQQEYSLPIEQDLKNESLSNKDISDEQTAKQEEVKELSATHFVENKQEAEEKLVTTLQQLKLKKVQEADTSVNQAPLSTFEDDFKKFLSQKEYYNNFSSWEKLFQSTSFNQEVKQSIKDFLVTRPMLVDDNTRFKILSFCELREEDFTTEKEKLLFNQHIQTNNFLNYDFYSYIPKDNRDLYFIQRYKLYRLIQVPNSKVSLKTDELEQLSKSNYQDNDLNYLISVYALIHPEFATAKEIRARLDEINNDKYLHDVEVLKHFVDLINNPKAPIVSNVDIIGLSWVSDDIKEQLMTRLKEIRRVNQSSDTTLSRGNPYLKTKSQTPKGFQLWKLIAGFFLVVAFIFGVIGFIRSDNQNGDFSFIDEVTYFDDDEDWEYDDDFDVVEYKQDTRATNVKINYDVYNLLIHDEEVDDDFSAIREDVFIFLDKIKQERSEDLSDLTITDLFEDINETHDLTLNDTVVTYTSFKENNSFFLKTTTNNTNEITKIEAINKDNMPKNSQLGTLDATLFFMEDLTTYFDDLDSYLNDLEDLYDGYLTEELYQNLLKIDEEQYAFLSEFAYAKPHLIPVEDKTVLLLTNFDEDFLFLELNDTLKINKLYFDFFEDVPKEYLQKANELNADFESDNPWAYELGVNF